MILKAKKLIFIKIHLINITFLDFLTILSKILPVCGRERNVNLSQLNLPFQIKSAVVKMKHSPINLNNT